MPKCKLRFTKSHWRTGIKVLPTFALLVDPDCISFTCERRWDSSENLFWFQLTWILPPYLFDWNNISYLRGFYVFARMIDGEGSVIDRFSSPQIQVPLQQVYSIKLGAYRPQGHVTAILSCTPSKISLLILN